MQIDYETGTDLFTGTSGQNDPNLPQVTVAKNVQHILQARATIGLRYCTITTPLTVTLKLRRISGTPGDIAHSSVTVQVGNIGTSGTNEVDIPIDLPPVQYTSATRDTIRMIVSLDRGPTTGRLEIRDAAILVN